MGPFEVSWSNTEKYKKSRNSGARNSNTHMGASFCTTLPPPPKKERKSRNIVFLLVSIKTQPNRVPSNKRHPSLYVSFFFCVGGCQSGDSFRPRNMDSISGLLGSGAAFPQEAVVKVGLAGVAVGKTHMGGSLFSGTWTFKIALTV